jgi:RND family efflux transporter MFP subunit
MKRRRIDGLPQGGWWKAWLLGSWLSCQLWAADPMGVTLARPKRGEITRYVTLPGTLRANQQVTLQARVAGFVSSIVVDRGDRVKAGQVLAEIEVPELIAERTRLLAEVQVAETESKRLTSAQQKSSDLVTPQSVDTAKGRWDVARAQLEKTEILLRYATLRAPFAGVITARFVDTGAYVPAGAVGGASAVVTLADVSMIRMQVPVPEVEAVHVKHGQPVRLSVDGFPIDHFRGIISRYSGVLDESNRSMIVEADLPNSENSLRPGMFATVRLGVERHTEALLIPTEAIAMEKTSSFVFRVDNGVCRKTAVKLGFQEGVTTEILAGIAEDSVLISPAKLAPPEGGSVVVKEAK